MVYENDNLVIPQEYRNMSITELRKEKKRIEKTLPTKKKNKKGSKLSNSSIHFNM